MKNRHVSFVFDRDKRLEKDGFSSAEVRIQIGSHITKFIKLGDFNLEDFKAFKRSYYALQTIRFYEEIIELMKRNEEEMTIDNLDDYILSFSGNPINENRDIHIQRQSSSSGFIDFIMDCLAKEKINEGTKKHIITTVSAIKLFGKLSSFVDLTPQHIKEFDEKLRTERLINGRFRTETTVYNYHKILKKYTKLALEHKYIQEDPYKHELCQFKRGRTKYRLPLTQEELKTLIEFQFDRKKLEIARDIFIFCAYTGLSYADSQNFSFETMAEEINGDYYVNGERMKTKQPFFTPILKPAMDVLIKYGYNLPKISNQKLNDHLHLVEIISNIHKPLTSHIARHSFASFVINEDVPIDKLARMLGHSNTNITQVYGKVSTGSIVKHAKRLARVLQKKGENSR